MAYQIEHYSAYTGEWHRSNVLYPNEHLANQKIELNLAMQRQGFASAGSKWRVVDAGFGPTRPRETAAVKASEQLEETKPAPFASWRNTVPATSGDEKIKTAAGKCPLNMIPMEATKGPSRVFQYGGVKYKPGNYHTADDSEIANRYMGGALRHLAACQQPNGLFSMQSIAALDEESGLPELDHAIAGLLMLRSLAIKHGALPADPGVGKPPPKKET